MSLSYRVTELRLRSGERDSASPMKHPRNLSLSIFQNFLYLIRYTLYMAEQDDFTEDEIRREDSPFQTRDRLRQILPGVQTLFDHSDDNIRTGKGFTDERGQHSVLSRTVFDERLNGGKATLVPSVYDGREITDERQVIERAVRSGKPFPHVPGGRGGAAEIDAFAPFISQLMGNDFADAKERKEQAK